MSKSAFVAVVGRPSAGKSTLVNALCGHKVSIVSPVPQTTRNAIRGIHTSERGQLIFIDTPGYHQSERKFNLKLTGIVKGSMGDCDLVLYLVDSSRHFGEEEQELMEMVAGCHKPFIVVLNKADLTGMAASTGAGVKSIAESAGNAVGVRKALLEGLPKANTTIEISALSGVNLEALKDLLFNYAVEGHEWYPAEFYTDQEPDFRITEMIREQVMNRTREEIPHAAYVEIADLDLRQADGTIITPADNYDVEAAWELPASKKPRLTIRAFVCVERDSQKGIVVGKGGTVIKAIRESAEQEIRKLFPYFVTLDLRVKVAPKWRNDDGLIERMIH